MSSKTPEELLTRDLWQNIPPFLSLHDIFVSLNLVCSFFRDLQKEVINWIEQNPAQSHTCHFWEERQGQAYQSQMSRACQSLLPRSLRTCVMFVDFADPGLYWLTSNAARLQSLHLNFVNAVVWDRDIFAIASATGLQELIIHPVGILEPAPGSLVNLEPLARLPLLRSLVIFLPNTSCRVAPFPVLQKLHVWVTSLIPGLEAPNLQQSYLHTDESIFSLNSLKSLNNPDGPIYRNLHSLELRQCSWEPSPDFFVAHGPALKMLQCTASLFEKISPLLTNLAELRIEDADLERLTFENTLELRKVTFVDIEYNTNYPLPIWVLYGFQQELERLANLEELTFLHCRLLPDEIWGILTGLKKLRTLNLGNSCCAVPPDLNAFPSLQVFRCPQGGELTRTGNTWLKTDDCPCCVLQDSQLVWLKQDDLEDYL